VAFNFIKIDESGQSRLSWLEEHFARIVNTKSGGSGSRGDGDASATKDLQRPQWERANGRCVVQLTHK